MKVTASGACPEVGLAVNTAVGAAGPPPEGIEAASIRMSSSTRLATSVPVAPTCTRFAPLIQGPVLVAAKGLAYAICLACGFRGGAIFPAIFLGVGFAMFPVVWFDVSPTVAVAMGAAAGTAAQARLVLSAMLFAAVLVGSQGTDTVPAAVLAAVASWLTTTALDRAESPAAAGSQHPA